MKQQYNATILSSDEIRKNYFNDETDQTHNEQVFDILYNILKNKISAKQNIIIDATNITIKSRKKLITVIRQYEKQ